MEEKYITILKLWTVFYSLFLYLLLTNIKNDEIFLLFLGTIVWGFIIGNIVGIAAVYINDTYFLSPDLPNAENTDSIIEKPPEEPINDKEEELKKHQRKFKRGLLIAFFICYVFLGVL